MRRSRIIQPGIPPTIASRRPRRPSCIRRRRSSGPPTWEKKLWVTRLLPADGLVSVNEFAGARPRRLKGHHELWRQRPDIRKTVRFRTKHDDGYRIGNQILLKGQVSIHGDECIKLSSGEGQQLAVLDRGPAHLTQF